MTTQECRNEIVGRLDGRGFVGVAEIIAECRDELGMTAGQVIRDLRVLVRQNRLEKRPSDTETNAWGGPSNEYLVDIPF